MKLNYLRKHAVNTQKFGINAYGAALHGKAWQLKTDKFLHEHDSCTEDAVYCLRTGCVGEKLNQLDD